MDAHHTRLVGRIRMNIRWEKPTLAVLDLFTEFADHVAVRKVFQGVKDRAEGHIEPMVWQNLEFILYVLAAFVFCGAAALLVVRPLSWERWFAGLCAGLSWLAVWYGPFPLPIGTMLEMLIVGWLYCAFARSRCFT